MRDTPASARTGDFSMTDRRQFLLGAGALAAAGSVFAASYPSGLIRIVYNFAPGGPGDAIARHLAEQMSARLGQQVIVENRAGGDGSIGILAVARSRADGLTLLFTTLSGVVQLPYVTGDHSFDPVKSLQPVATVGSAPLVILANPGIPANDFPGFVQWARAEKAPVQIAGAGPIIELAIARLAQATGLKLEFIPYRGSAPAIQAVLGGEVGFYFMPPSAMTTELVRSARLKVIGVTSAEPSGLVAGGKPIDQQVPGYVQEVHYCLWAPPGTPSDATGRLAQVLREVLAMPGTHEKLFAYGIEARYGNGDEVTTIILREAENIRRILATTPVKFGQ